MNTENFVSLLRILSFLSPCRFQILRSLYCIWIYYKFSRNDYQYVHISASHQKTKIMFWWVHHHRSLSVHVYKRTHTVDTQIRKKYKCSQEGKSQKKITNNNWCICSSLSSQSGSIWHLLVAPCSHTGILRHVHGSSFQVSWGLNASRRSSHRLLAVCRGRWSLLCHPLIRIIKLSQPAAHKWGILPAPPSCRDSLQIASDSPPDCAMIMLSLDAVIMMAHNCWCALAAAQRLPISLSTCLYNYRPPLYL